MKKTIICFLLNFFLLSIHAQRPLKFINGGSVAPMLAQPAPLPAPAPAVGVPPAVPIGFRDTEVKIGITRHETQCIGSLGHRVGVSPDGQVSAVWLHGLDQQGGWPGRGTAYNHFDGTAWGAEPDARIEAVRSGYPSFAITSNGREVVLSHRNTSPSDWFLQVHTKMTGDTEWTETTIPSSVPGGPVWGKVATGGPDGNTIHAVAVSLATTFGGEVYKGMDQHPLYYRSTDGGATWDKVDVIIPGLDSSAYLGVAGEAYNISANGQTVAIGVFDAWGDVAVFKSTDNGETWSKSIINDFPLDKYDGSGYGPGDVPYDPVPDDSVSIFTADYSGSVLVDDNGKVHVFFSIIYVFAQGNSFFLNLVADGIAYWNEDFSPGELAIIGAAPDIDGDGLINVQGTYSQLRYNNTNLTSFPTSGQDEQGNLYVVFNTLREDLVSFKNVPYRHAFIVKSTDGGLSWSEPFDLINSDVSEFFDFIEAAYPSIPARIGNRIDLVYMQDYEPGLTPQGIMIAEQFIMHVAYNKDTFEPNFSEQILQPDNKVTLNPNPASQTTSVFFELNSFSNVTIRIVSLTGTEVYFKKIKNLPAGRHSHRLNLNALAPGLYFIQLQIGAMQFNKKLIVN